MRVKVANLRQPNQPIMFNYKGKQYLLSDMEVNDLPADVVRHLADKCSIRTFRQRQIIDDNGQPKMESYPVEVPRFSVSPVARQYVEKDVGTANDKK